MLLRIRRNTNSSSTAPCRPLLSSLDCFTVTTGGRAFDPGAEISFNRYAQDNNTGVITIPLCQTEGRFGCDGDEAYVVRHPDWNATSFKNDIALIFLPEGGGRQVANLPNVALNCIPNVPVDGQELEVFGWGLTCEPSKPDPPCPDGELPNDIQTGKLKYLTNEDCDTLYCGFCCGVFTVDMLCANTDSTSGVAVGGGDPGMCNSCWASIFSRP